MSEERTLDEFGEREDSKADRTGDNLRLPEVDQIPTDWRLVTVEDVAENLIGGGTPSKDQDEYWGGEIPWASVKDLDGIKLSETEEYITEQGLNDSTANTAPEDSVIISTRMTVGEPFLNEVRMAINQDMKAILPDRDSVNSLFLVYSLWDKDPYLKSLGRGTTVDGITTRDLSSTHLGLPPLPEQRKIATVLRTVDRAIEKTEEIIAQTKETKQGLAQSFFSEGYFEYSESTDAHHRNRLPRHPDEWSTRPADAVMDVTRGAHPRPKSDKTLWDGEIPIIKISDRNRGDSQTITSTDDTVTEKGRQSSKLVDEGTLIVSNAGTVGIARITGMRTCIHDHWLILRNYEEQLSKRYLLHFINWNQEFLQSLASGSTVDDLNTDDFRLFDITFPRLEEQRKIADVLDSLHEQRMTNMEYVDRLQRVKQGLMQDLFSGEVRTTDKSIEVPDEISKHG